MTVLAFKAKAQATDNATKQHLYSELLAAVSIRAIDTRWAAYAFRERFGEAPGEDLVATKARAEDIDTDIFAHGARRMG